MPRENLPWSVYEPPERLATARHEMNGYVESGYVVTLVSLGAYGASLAVRQRAARRRLPASPPSEGGDSTSSAEESER